MDSAPKSWRGTPKPQRRTHSRGAHSGPIRPSPRTSIHRSAWNRNSRKFICRILHSPARTPLGAALGLIIRCI